MSIFCKLVHAARLSATAAVIDVDRLVVQLLLLDDECHQQQT